MTVRRRGSDTASTTAQPSEIAMWVGTAASTSGTVRVSRGNTSVPAARVASNGSARVISACNVDGTPLHAAATDAATSASSRWSRKLASAGPTGVIHTIPLSRITRRYTRR